MTRLFTRLAALLGSAISLLYLTAVAASARPIGEHVGSTVDSGAQGLQAGPVDVVQSGTPLISLVVAGAVMVLMAVAIVLVVRAIHSRHGHSHHVHAV
jgi:hypothetical protein